MINFSTAGPSYTTPGETPNTNLEFVDESSVLPQTDLSATTAASFNLDGTFTTDAETADRTATSLGSMTPGFLKTAKHPLTCVFHLLFKVIAFLCFLFGSVLFGGWEGDYVFTFVTTTVFLSVDFWTVKNITGRVLVGMRWWNNIVEDGSNTWIYESATDERMINTTDKTVFWSALYVWTLIWAIFLILYIIRLQIEWVLLVAVGLVLSGSNLVGYWKCSKDAKRRMKEWASTQAMKSILGRFGG